MVVAKISAPELTYTPKFYAHAKLVFSYYRVEKAEWLVACMLLIHKFANDDFENIRHRYVDLQYIARQLKRFFDFSENGRGALRLGALLFHIDVYFNVGTLVSPPNDFQFDSREWSGEFSDKELDIMSRSYVAESKVRFGAPSLDKIISKILFIEQHISRG